MNYYFLQMNILTNGNNNYNKIMQQRIIPEIIKDTDCVFLVKFPKVVLEDIA